MIKCIFWTGRVKLPIENIRAGGMIMNRTKYRAWLISIVLAATIFGIFYYVYTGNQEKTITDGTLVYQEDWTPKGEAAA